MATSKGRGRPRLLTLEEIRARNAAELKIAEVKPGSGLQGLQQRYAEKLKRERIYV